jgi:hypothetical protein
VISVRCGMVVVTNHRGTTCGSKSLAGSPEREGKRYTSDWTDAEWALIEPQMPAANVWAGRARPNCAAYSMRSCISRGPAVSGECCRRTFRGSPRCKAISTTGATTVCFRPSILICSLGRQLFILIQVAENPAQKYRDRIVTETAPGRRHAASLAPGRRCDHAHFRRPMLDAVTNSGPTYRNRRLTARLSHPAAPAPHPHQALIPPRTKTIKAR